MQDRTLLEMRLRRRYARWLFEKARPYLGEHVVEAGSGIGTQSEILVKWAGGRRKVVLTEPDPARLDELRRRFPQGPALRFTAWELPGPYPGPGRPDTFVAWNVLEHVEDDVRALISMRRALAPGGRVVIASPGAPSLFSPFDRAVGHYRRYGRGELSRKARAAGLAPLIEKPFDLAGALGWLVFVKFLGGAAIPGRSARVFDLLVPAFEFLEGMLPVPWGLSVLFVGERRG